MFQEFGAASLNFTIANSTELHTFFGAAVCAAAFPPANDAHTITAAQSRAHPPKCLRTKLILEVYNAPASATLRRTHLFPRWPWHSRCGALKIVPPIDLINRKTPEKL